MNREISLCYKEFFMQVYNDIDALTQQLKDDVAIGHITQEKCDTLLAEAVAAKGLYVYAYNSTHSDAKVVGVFYSIGLSHDTPLSAHRAALMKAFVTTMWSIAGQANINAESVLQTHWWVYVCERVFRGILSLVLDKDSTYHARETYLAITTPTVYRTYCVSVIATPEAFAQQRSNTKVSSTADSAFIAIGHHAGYSNTLGSNLTVMDSFGETAVTTCPGTGAGTGSCTDSNSRTPVGYDAVYPNWVNADLQEFFTSTTHDGMCYYNSDGSDGAVAVRMDGVSGVTMSDMCEVITTHMHELLHYVARLLRAYESNAGSSASICIAWECLVYGFVYHSIWQHLDNWEADSVVTE